MAKRHITLPDSFESLFIRLEEIILANSGEDEFEEIFKLVVAKLWDELNNTNFFNSVTNELVAEVQIEDVLKKIEKSWPGVICETRTKLGSQHLFICIKLLSDFKFIDYGFEALDAFFEFIVSRIKKGSKGQYFTPRYIVDFCVRILNPGTDELILDPASGSGAFLLHSYNYVKDNHNELGKDDLINIGSKLWGFDFDEKAIRISKVLMYVAGIQGVNIHKLNSLIIPELQTSMMLSNNVSQITTIEDFLRIKKTLDKFDIILTNPPFAGEIVEQDLLKSYKISSSKSRIERDVLFVERCLDLLKPGGRMAIILPDNKFGSSEWTDLRKLIIEKARIVGVIGLPRNTFMPHTPVKTSILFVERRKTYNINQYEKVFFGISESSGKDSRGNLEYLDESVKSWKNVKNDLSEIEIEFRRFLQSEKIGW